MKAQYRLKEAEGVWYVQKRMWYGMWVNWVGYYLKEDAEKELNLWMTQNGR